MANLFLFSRKAFVMCAIKNFLFWRLSNDCQIVRPALVFGPPNRKKPYNKHLISLVFFGPRASRLGHKSMENNSVRNLQYGPKTRLIRGMYVTSENSETPGVRSLIPGITLAKWLQTWKLFLDNKRRWNSSKVCIRPCTGMDLGTFLWSQYGIIVSLPLSDKILKLCHYTNKSAP